MESSKAERKKIKLRLANSGPAGTGKSTLVAVDELPPSDRLNAIYNAIAKHLPKIDTKDYSELLWSSTAYPMGDTQYLVDQIIELAAKTDGSLRQCQAYADMETTKAMLDLIES